MEKNSSYITWSNYNYSQTCITEHHQNFIKSLHFFYLLSFTKAHWETCMHLCCHAGLCEKKNAVKVILNSRFCWSIIQSLQSEPSTILTSKEELSTNEWSKWSGLFGDTVFTLNHVHSELNKISSRRKGRCVKLNLNKETQNWTQNENYCTHK